jgi:rRNA maturation endonuclease Nob1
MLTLLELQMGANTVGNQKVHCNWDVYSMQNVEHNHNVQFHEIPNLSLDC